MIDRDLLKLKKDYLKKLYQQKRITVEDLYLTDLSDVAVNMYSTEAEKIELIM